MNISKLSLTGAVTWFSHPGDEEQGSMAEVSYYSYEYDPDSEPFLADGGAHSELLEGGGDVEQKAPQPTDIQLLPLPDTKNAPQRWYHTFSHHKHCVYRVTGSTLD